MMTKLLYVLQAFALQAALATAALNDIVGLRYSNTPSLRYGLDLSNVYYCIQVTVYRFG